VPTLDQALLFLHFIGLGLGMSASFGNLVMGKLIGDATPAERPVLARFPPVISRVGAGGLVLLWATGLVLTFHKWGGFASLPWQFHVKITGVVLLTLVVGVIESLHAKAKRGDAAAAARLPAIGSIATVLVLLIVLFAVLTFD
jgi:hypothetical protein